MSGPLVMVAAGGVLTEIYRDRSLRLAPVDCETAHEMIAEVRGAGCTAQGISRQAEPAISKRWRQAIVALSRLATMEQPIVHEAEINPLIVRAEGQGVVAVDALVKLMV